MDAKITVSFCFFTFDPFDRRMPRTNNASVLKIGLSNYQKTLGDASAFAESHSLDGLDLVGREDRHRN